MGFIYTHHREVATAARRFNSERGSVIKSNFCSPESRESAGEFIINRPLADCRKSDATAHDR